MSMLALVEKVRLIAGNWGEKLEPPASEYELEEFIVTVGDLFGVTLPKEYLNFLKIVNGIEFNGFILFGTKNSELNSLTSSLDLCKLNKTIRDANTVLQKNMLIIGENSTSIILYDNQANKFQWCDRIAMDRVESYESFDSLLRIEVERAIL